MFNDFPSFIDVILDLIKTTIPVVASLTLLMFFWGLVKFIGSAGDESAVKDGRDLMIWGLIALFVMFSIWGIMAFLANQFGFSGLVPQLPTS